MTVPRSLILAPTESAYGTSYRSSIVTLVPSCPVSEYYSFFYAKSHFFHTPLIFRPEFRGVPFGVYPIVCKPRLTSREIIFEVFQPVLCDHDISTSRIGRHCQTDKQTDSK